MKLELPWWLGGTELTQLKTAAEGFWQQVFEYAAWPQVQLDAEHCDRFMLPLLAWQRDITRFQDEPEQPYRLRIKHAYANALDAGSTAGLKRIFERLGLGYLDIAERQPDKDWDVVVLQVADSTLAQQPDYMSWLIQTYGRTCRRYEWAIMTPIRCSVQCGEAGAEYQTVRATI